jgi:hypothetical protein
MSTLEYLIRNYDIDISKTSPIEIQGIVRNDLPIIFKDLGFTQGAEIGVLKAVFSEILIKDNPNLTLYGIDPWLKYQVYKDFRGQKQLDSYYREAKERMTPYENYVFVKKMSMDAVKDFRDNSLDFVYIDADHEYAHVMEDITEWSKKVRPGGIVSGHDYHLSSHAGSKMQVPYAVDAYTSKNKIHPWFLLGLKDKNKDPHRDPSRSWMWIKP